MMRPVTLLLCLMILLCSVPAAGGAQKKAETGKPNVVLIVIESLRRDHVGCYGYFRNTTPSIDLFAKQATRFTNAIATASYTTPTHISIFTGLYYGVHGVGGLEHPLDQKIPTLAGILKGAGFHTVGFVSNPTLVSAYGYNHGFDLYDDRSVFAELDRSHGEIRTAPTSGILNRIVLAWLKDHHGEQFFLFLHYFDPHFDYCPPPPCDRIFDPDYTGTADCRNMTVPRSLSDRDLDHVKALYDGEIRYTDEHIGTLLKEMARYGLTDKTLFIVLADHGDEFYEHGGVYHETTLYGELINIPLLVKFPGQTKANTVDALVSQVDILPTVCDYLKIKAPGVVQGESLLPLMRGEKKEVHPCVFSELDFPSGQKLKAVETPDHKLIRNFITRRSELFSMKDDSAECRDLSPKGFFSFLKPGYDRVRELKKELAIFMQSNERLTSSFRMSQGSRAVLDEKTRQRLKSLGYIQ